MVSITQVKLPSSSVLQQCMGSKTGRCIVSPWIKFIQTIYKIFLLEMNDSKCLHVLAQSGRCYVPIDDPPEVVIRKITEVLFVIFV